MARSRVFQPATIATSDLVIGLMKVSLGSADKAVKTAADHDLTNNPGAPATPMASVGALKSASLAMAPTFREHRSGYPQVLDFKIADLLSAVYKFELEEIGSPTNLGLLDDAIDTLETGSPKYRAIEALAEFASGGTLSLFSNYAQLKPNLAMNFGDDFSAAPFEFEALANPNWANANELVYRLRTAGAARDKANQPITVSPANLAIGMFQVRVGKPSRRGAGAASLSAVQKRKHGATWDSAVNTLAVGTASGTYAGGVDGAFVGTVTSVSPLTIDFVGPDGTAYADIVFDTQAVAEVIGDGVSLAFNQVSSTYHVVGDVWVIGAYAAGPVDFPNTGIISPYSFLTSANSVGAIQSAGLTTNPTYKDHFSGFPKVKDISILESSTMTIDTALEEISALTGSVDLTPGLATTIYDMIFDASRAGYLYNVPVEIVANLATGLTLSFWFPNCQIIPTGEFAPSNEWATQPFQLEAQIQNGMRRIYRQSLVPNI